MGAQMKEVLPTAAREICKLTRELSGIDLDETKAYLIRHRLEPILEEFDCEDYEQLCRRLRDTAEEHLRQSLIDAMTTNETSFFRDGSPFEALARRIVPDIVDGRGDGPNARRLRIWSAASSTGQEAYSIAIRLRELIPDIESWDIKITGTDISSSAVDQASRGEYSDIEVRRGMTTDQLERHFDRRGSLWVVKPGIRRMVRFQRRNLLNPLTGLGPFDVVFCRNVGIYFERSVRDDLFHRMDQLVSASGYVFLSNSEYLETICPNYVQQLHCGAIYYRKIAHS